MTVTFREWSEGGDADPEDPDTVTAVVINVDTDEETSLDVESGDDTAEYYVDWTPTEEGDFILRMTGEFSDGSTDIIDQSFTVGSSSSSTTTNSLSEDVILSFASGLSPMYISAEEIAVSFPEAPLIDIAEQIFIYSTEAKSLLDLDDDLEEEDIPLLVFDYVRAAVSCTLSKTYELSPADEMSFRLGDLSVTNRNYAKSKITRGNATTWCELAYALRNELVSANTGMIGVVKSANWANPIPHRKLKRF